MASKRNGKANGKPEQSPAVDVCHENDAVVVRIPVKFYRRNGRQSILTVADAADAKSRADRDALVLALARAWRWQEELESDQYATVEDLASAKGIDLSYVRRMLRLNSLAPDIVDAIMENAAPDGISLRSLYRGIAPGWTEQRRTC